MIDLTEIKKRKRRPLILDGAIGSLIQQKNFKKDQHLWMSRANLENPEMIRDIHLQYIDAGADIITTNTFRTNPAAFEKSGLNISQDHLVKKSVEIAKSAALKNDVFVAGSNAPAEDSYQKERNLTYNQLVDNHQTHINQLWEYGCDIIFNETQSHLDEIEIICEHCSSNKINWIISLFFTEDLKILSGEKLEPVLEKIFTFKPNAVGLNCILPTTAETFLKNYSFDYNWGIYLNCGSGNYTDTTISCGIVPEQYLKTIETIYDNNLLFVGSCCGSNPGHTKALRNFFDQ